MANGNGKEQDLVQVVTTDTQNMVTLASAEKSRSVGEAADRLIKNFAAMRTAQDEALVLLEEAQGETEDWREVQRLGQLMQQVKDQRLQEALEEPTVLQVAEQMYYHSLGIASGINIAIRRDAEGKRIFPSLKDAEQAVIEQTQAAFKKPEGFIKTLFGKLFGLNKKESDLKFRSSAVKKYY